MDPQNQLPEERRSKSWLFLLIIPVLIILFVVMMTRGGGSNNDLKYSEVIGYFQNDQVQEYKLSFKTGKVTILLREDYREDINGDKSPISPETKTQNVASAAVVAVLSAAAIVFARKIKNI